MKKHQPQTSTGSEVNVQLSKTGNPREGRKPDSLVASSGIFNSRFSRLAVLFFGLLLSSSIAFAQQASNIVINPVSGSIGASNVNIRFDWTNGNVANSRIVVIMDATGVYIPSGAAPTANTVYGSGTDLDGGGGFVQCVYNNTGGATANVTVTAIPKDAIYRIAVFEFAAGPVWNVATAANNPMIFRTFTATGDNAWAIPTGIKSLVAQTWGAGGGGGSGGGNGGSGGGAGGYSSSVVTLGATFNATVGAGGAGGLGSSSTAPVTGDDTFVGVTNVSASATVKALGGAHGNNNSTATGGAGGAAGTGTIKKVGGTGGKGESSSGGGGGSSAAPDANGTGHDGNVGSDGNSGTGGAGGPAEIGGGAGGTGQNNMITATANPGFWPGGGGAGTQDNNANLGGAGANGLVVISYTRPINQDLVFTADITKGPGQAVTIVSSLNTNNNVWFAPAGTTTFAASATMTKATNGLSTSILSPTTAGAYKLFIVDAMGNISTASTATLTVDTAPPTFSTLVVAGDNSGATLTLGESAFSTSGGTGALDGTKVTVTISGGTASLSGYTITHTAGSTSVAIGLTLTGTPNGSEIVTVHATNNTSIFDPYGNAMASATTITANLFDKAAPVFSTLVVAANNATATLTFDAGVWGTAGAAGALDMSKVNVTVTGGTASLTTYSITHVAGTNSVLIGLTLSGTVNGSEIVTVNATTNASIFDTAGNPMAAATTITANLKAPKFSTLVVAGTNATATLTFNGPVYSTAAAAGNLDETKVTVGITGGVATLTTYTVTHVAGTNSALITLTLGGTPTGAEVVTVTPFDGASIYDAGGNPMPVAGSSITANLNDKTPPAFGTLTIAGTNATGTLTFSDPVYGTAGAAGALDGTKVTVTVTGGTATLSGYTITHTAGTNSLSIGLTLSGLADGSEVVTVHATNNTSIFDAAGNPMASATLKTANLHDLLPPLFNTLVVAANNATATLTFDAAVFGTAAAAGALDGSKVTVTVTGGVATLSGYTITHTAGTNSVLIGLTLSGVPTGAEILTVKPTTAASIFDTDGNAMAAATTKTANLNDFTPPVVSSIVTASATNAWSSTKGTSAPTVDFLVTFSEIVTGVDPTDFTVTTTGSVAGTSIGVAGTGLTRTVTVSGYTGTGTLHLNFTDDDTVIDAASNPAGGAGAGNADFTTGQTYSIVLGPPGGQVTGLGATPVGNYQIQLNWTNPSSGQAPTHLVLLAKANAAAYATTNDGFTVTQEENFSNDNAAVIIPFGATSYLWNLSNPVSMHSGLQYDFIVVPYTLSSNNTADNTDYLFPGNPTISAFTNVGSTGTLLTGSTLPFANIAATLDAVSAPGQIVFSFQIQEDGSNNAIDDAATVFTSLTIGDNSSSATPWSDIIGLAQLKDATGGTFVNSAPIVSNVITFNTTGAIGTLADGQLKDYELRLYLKNPMTGAAKEMVDGTQLAFLVNNASFLFAAHSSGLAPLQAQTSPGGNVIKVTATKFIFSTQPNTTQLVRANVTSVSAAPDLSTSPVIRAVDPNGNTQLNYTTPINITNAGGILQNNLPLNQVVPIAGKAQFPATFNYDDSGNGQLTATGSLTTAVSGPVTVSYSALSTITAGAGGEPLTISSLSTALPGTQVFDFVITDDGGPGIGDGAPTRISQIVITPEATNQIDWAQSIAGATLTGTGLPISASLINAAGITFPINPATDGLIADGGNRTYTLRIWLSTTIPVPLRNSIDNDKFVFEVTRANVSLTTTSSTILPGEKEDSGAGPVNNAVDVDATKLEFTTNPLAALLPNKDISTQAPIPVVEAVDANMLRDTDYTSTNFSIVSLNGLTMINAPGTGSLSGGLATFANNFQFTSVGNGALRASSSLPFALANGFSIDPIDVAAGKVSTITGGTGTPTISSLATLIGSPVSVFQFTINDDPVGAAVDDGTPTLVTGIKITQSGNDPLLANWTQSIAGAFISDGVNPDQAGVVNNTDITFTGIPIGVNQLGYVQDGAPGIPKFKTYVLKIYLKNPLSVNLPNIIDGLAFGFGITGPNVTTSAAGTGILGAPLQSQSSGPDVVTVVATRLDYTVLPFVVAPGVANAFPTQGSQFTPFSPRLAVEAHDARGNLDLNFNGNIASFSVAVPLTTLAGGNPAGSFSGGQYTFPINFQYTSGNNQDGTISLTAGPTGAGAAGAVAGNSPPINIVSSFESRIAQDPTFIFGLPSPNIPYIAYQGQNDPAPGGSILPADIGLGNGSFELARLVLSDGDADGTPNDQDGATTVLTRLRLKIANAGGTSTLNQIYHIALYNSGAVGASEIAEKIVSGTDISNGYIEFNGLNIVAPDDNKVGAVFTPTPISIRVTFQNPTAGGTIVDKTLLRVSVIDAQLGGGSQFKNSIGDEIAGVSGGFIAPVNANFIDVVATKLDFVSPFPAPFAGVNETKDATGIVDRPAGVVWARDQFEFLDVDFNNISANVNGVSAGVNPAAFKFTNGVLDLTAASLSYGDEGNGKLTVTTTSPSLSSNVANTVGGFSNVADQCPGIEVIHVTTISNDGGPGGVLTSTNILAGSTKRVIFGFQFSSLYSLASDPQVTRFTLTFNQSTSTVFSAMRVLESTSGVFDPLLPQVAFTQPTPNTLQVDLSASPRSLLTNPSLSYFLSVDVNINVNGSTTPVQVSIVDNGNTSTSKDNILVLNDHGSQKSNTTGRAYTFASIAPPTLVSSYPAVAQSNIDITQDKLSLSFSVPVFLLSTDIAHILKGTITLVEKESGDSTQLVPVSGSPYVLGQEQLPIVFNIPTTPSLFLKTNKTYYVKIPKGVANNAKEGSGIMDVNQNLFPGIFYDGTLYFKTSDGLAPALLGTDSSLVSDPKIIAPTNASAILSAALNRPGTVYYLVVPHLAAAPTVTQIFAGGTGYVGTIEASGNYPVDITRVAQSGVITPTTGFFSTGTHDVYVAAEAYKEKNGTRTALKVGGHYGPSTTGFIANSSPLPTMTFSVSGPNTNPNITTNLLSPPTSIVICSNTYQVLNTPIIFSEGTTQTFQQAGVQTMNLVLPNGFLFDVTQNTSTGVPIYGTVKGIGPDFTGTPPSLKFLSTSVLRITFTNTGFASTSEQLIISGLKVIGNGAQNGSIFRLGGNAMPFIGDGNSIGGLTATEANSINFNNEYSTSLGTKLSRATPNAVVETAIPDNLPDTQVGLTPYIPYPVDTYDFGPSTFSGQGVIINNINILGVTKDVPFNITITHTDNNGCTSKNDVQYVVYDHNFAVNISGINGQGPYSSPNPDFLIGQTVPWTSPGVVHTIPHDNLPGYRMDRLTAKIPKKSTSFIDTASFSGAWVNIVKNLPVKVDSVQFPVGSGPWFVNYSFDEKQIINARALSGNVIRYTYDYFKGTVNPASPTFYPTQTYYTGGSLGFVEFTGRFSNTSNPTVVINRRQIVEFFLPPVPTVEIVTPYSKLDMTDPGNAVGSGGPNGSRPGNTGTPVFCQYGGDIIINGWPAVTTGQSVGTFTLTDVSGSPISMAGFTDNGNGTAKLNPAVLTNGFDDIRIVYTFKEDKNPLSGTAYQTIRISPNPVARFAPVAVLGPNVPAVTSFCVGKQIIFDSQAAGHVSSIASPTAPSTPANIITRYHWNFGDVNASAPNVNDIDSTFVTFPHNFGLPQTYLVSLSLRSNWGCASVPSTGSTQTIAEVVNVKVGNIPVIKTKLTGVYAGQTFNFTDNGSTASINTPPLYDAISLIEWDLVNTVGDTVLTAGVPPPFVATVPSGLTAAYSLYTPGKYLYDVRVTSQIGCVNYLSLQPNPIAGATSSNYRDIVVVPRFDLSVGGIPGVHVQDFDVNNGSWQTFATGRTVEDMHNNKRKKISWEHYNGAPPVYSLAASDVMIFNEPGSSVVNGAGLWKTNLSTVRTPQGGAVIHSYYDQEKSALYSPSFDITALGRPMISFNSAVQLENSDGVVLQFSKDNLNVADPAKVWTTLGLIGDGEDWYTEQGLAGKPGDQIGGDFGWSGNASPRQLSPKHVLDQVGSGASNVVFRFALGSAKNEIAREGFSLDNFRIGNRTRTILLESFVNTSNTVGIGTVTSEKVQADSIAQFIANGVGTEVVKVNYHVSFPGKDPFNEDNPGDPSGRALYYNIVKTPRSILDGEKDPLDNPWTTWGRPLYNLRTLQLAQAGIDVVAVTNPNGSISITANVTSDLVGGVIPAKTVLHIAILEQTIPIGSLSGAQSALVKTGETSFDYTLKKMLPSAGGSPFGTPLVHTSPVPTVRTFGPFIWTPDPKKLYQAPGDLAVAVFLQQEDAPFEVYQVDIVRNLTEPSVVTGIEPIAAEDILVYPNPANHEMNIRMPGILAVPANITLVDQVGHITEGGIIPEGGSTKTLAVGDLSPGLYILQVEVGPGNIARKKVMIVH